MNGVAQKIVKYMDGADKRFIIPVYQRNYDWKIENCKQLFDDLIKVVKKGRKSHFFGSIVSVQSETGNMEEFLIIDGQQRLTTISLLFLAIYRLLDEKEVTSKDNQLKDKILKKYLIDEYEPQEKRIKLKPIKNDEEAFNCLFNNENDRFQNSNLIINYKYFYNRIQSGELSIDELFEAICKLEIINISLNHEDDPQLIFESLNSTGLALNEGDKIRNYILMGLPTKQQEIYYEKYWNKIESYTGYDVSYFIRDYLSVKKGTISQLSRVYYNFKEYYEATNQNNEAFLIDLLKYSEFYKILRLGGTNSYILNDSIYRLNRLETIVTRPFFLEVLRLHHEQEISLEDVTQIFITVENYIFRRTICDLPTNALNKIFLTLHKEIMKYDGTSVNYLEKFKFALISKKEKVRFPDDKEFSEMFTSKQIYFMNSKNKHYLFERLENYGTKECKNIWKHLDNGDYTIEHIMPQHLTPLWVKSLGKHYDQIHDDWLHRIANLTLTAYNSNYSNSTFLEKKTMKHGFIDSGLRMNQRISQKDKWTLTELNERNTEIKNICLEIWDYPKTNYFPPEKELDSFSLDEDIEFSGKSIAKFSFKNVDQPVSSWIDMYQKVIMILHSNDKSVLSYLAYSNDENIDLSNIVSLNANDFIKSIEIDDGIYILSNTNTQQKINSLRRLFSYYKEDPSDLVFYMNENNDDTNYLGTRFEIRKKYWDYALKVIRIENSKNKMFDNINSTIENWIAGVFGKSGFNICCIANYDSARVELYLGSDKSTNKKTFDKLYQYKNEIESKLKHNLVWDRGDEKKSSKIYLELTNVSISKESDWERMAKFHALWSKLFYDLIISKYII